MASSSDDNLVKALERRPLRPDLDAIRHRPVLRIPEDRPGGGDRVFRRYHDGTLDYEGALHTILDALWKLRDGAELTGIERAVASVVLPEADAPLGPEIAEITLKRLSAEEKRRLAALVLAHMLAVARADAQRTLARSASSWTLPEVRDRMAWLLVADPFQLGTADVVKAMAAPRAAGPGSRGGSVAYTTRGGRPVYTSQARRLAPKMDAAMTNWHQRATRSGDPEHHAIAAKQALAAAFYHHHAGDPVAAEQAMSYADHHAGRAHQLGHEGRTMRWIEQHHPATPATTKLLGLEGEAPPAAERLARSLAALARI